MLSKHYFTLSIVLLFMTALSGLLMRVFPFINLQAIEFEHILHAHSHLAILGWAFLGVIVIFFTISWKDLRKKDKLKSFSLLYLL